MYRLYTNPKEKSGHIHKELQGHFSEHLGRCIYEGIYVGENSPKARIFLKLSRPTQSTNAGGTMSPP